MANLDEYYEKGEKLYSDMATGADVFDPKYPDIGMFDKGDQWNPDYISASGRDISGERYFGGATPRSVHFSSEMRNLQSTLSDKDRTLAMSIEGSYGKKPRYSKSDDGYKLKSPYSFEKEHRESIKGMDRFDQTRAYSDLVRNIKSMPTDITSVERKVMDSMLKEDKAPWQDIEDPVARAKARYKSR